MIHIQLSTSSYDAVPVDHIVATTSPSHIPILLCIELIIGDLDPNTDNSTPYMAERWSYRYFAVDGNRIECIISIKDLGAPVKENISGGWEAIDPVDDGVVVIDAKPS